jgi:hypothetical protein
VVLHREAAGQVRLEREFGSLARLDLPLQVIAVDVDLDRAVGREVHGHPVALADGDLFGAHGVTLYLEVERAFRRGRGGRVEA